MVTDVKRSASRARPFTRAERSASVTLPVTAAPAGTTSTPSTTTARRSTPCTRLFDGALVRGQRGPQLDRQGRAGGHGDVVEHRFRWRRRSRGRWRSRRRGGRGAAAAARGRCRPRSRHWAPPARWPVPAGQRTRRGRGRRGGRARRRRGGGRRRCRRCRRRRRGSRAAGQQHHGARHQVSSHINSLLQVSAPAHESVRSALRRRETDRRPAAAQQLHPLRFLGAHRREDRRRFGFAPDRGQRRRVPERASSLAARGAIRPPLAATICSGRAGRPAGACGRPYDERSSAPE